ncbi:uncharacterized protein LOC132309874 [Cornus florida]|uniref:uncharacterized protein LOC132309874 n=1 Tax=Cornus florida TaxID=4283 RepID=UPI00289BD38F|nr:uncharacterized protein LOC132309874 [Cornus florida]
MRLLWDLQCGSSDRIWIKWCNSHLLKSRNIWSLKIPHSCTWSWRKILQLRYPARLLIKHKVGNGADTSFWWDNWAQGGLLCIRFLTNVLTDHGLNDSITLDNFIEGSTWSFPQSLTAIIPELMQLQLPCPSIANKKVWTASSTGQYNFSHTAAHLAGNLKWCRGLIWCGNPQLSLK